MVMLILFIIIIIIIVTLAGAEVLHGNKCNNMEKQFHLQCY